MLDGRRAGGTLYGIKSAAGVQQYGNFVICGDEVETGEWAATFSLQLSANVWLHLQHTSTSNWSQGAFKERIHFFQSILKYILAMQAEECTEKTATATSHPPLATQYAPTPTTVSPDPFSSS